jgi:hypothetical protein
MQHRVGAPSPHRGSWLLAIVVGSFVTVSLATGPGITAASAASWDGGVNLYRSGSFSTQGSWLWCTSTGIQIIRNMVNDTEDHSVANQSRWFDWMRGRNRYRLPESAGVDPAGWAAGLRQFVDARYRLQSHASFDQALRLAAIRIRKTGLPVALAVANGNHGWVLHGFTSTADPLTSDSFRVTSVRVTGPLWGRQNRSSGYDMKPNTKLTVVELRRFFTPWRYAPKPMIWDGRYVSIQPVTARTEPRSVAVRVEAPSPGAMVRDPGQADRRRPDRRHAARPPALPRWGRWAVK